MINKGTLTVRTNTCVLLLYMCEEGTTFVTDTCYMLLGKEIITEFLQSFPVLLPFRGQALIKQSPRSAIPA